MTAAVANIKTALVFFHIPQVLTHAICQMLRPEFYKTRNLKDCTQIKEEKKELSYFHVIHKASHLELSSCRQINISTGSKSVMRLQSCSR